MWIILVVEYHLYALLLIHLPLPCFIFMLTLLVKPKKRFTYSFEQECNSSPTAVQALKEKQGSIVH